MVSTQELHEATLVLRAGGLVIYPTETFYALGALASYPEAIKRVYEIKLRSETMPVLCLVEGREMILELASTIPPEAEALMRRFWPGPLTLVLPARDDIPRQLVGPTGGVGIRQSSHPMARALVRITEGPIVGTSANLSGQLPCVDPQELPPFLLRSVNMVLDGGRLPGGLPSTVVECMGGRPRILRMGIISREELREVLPID